MAHIISFNLDIPGVLTPRRREECRVSHNDFTILELYRNFGRTDITETKPSWENIPV